MAYECGYFGGYSDVECFSGILGCGGGNYGGAQYAAASYGGVVPCANTQITPNPIQSNVEEFCRIITSCGD